MAITTDDFNKIWASTSPLTPYEFSESNYKEGWNFIGSTPPARQMWDFLQKNNDEKMQYLADNYLPLSGGTMTGTITTSIGNMLKGSGTDGQYWISGGTPYDKGASVLLNGVDRTTDPGAFQLIARNANGTYKSFIGKPDGTLEWAGHTIPTTDSLFTTVTLTVTGNISANNWGDLIGTFAFPNGYTKVVGILGIIVSYPGSMTLTGWELFGSNSIRVRCRSINALTDATAAVTLMVAK